MAQDRDRKVSTGPNARPKDETIAQTGAGVPDDTGADNPDLRDEAERAEEAMKKPFKGRADDKQRGQRQPMHRLQDEPPEGDRETIEHELERKSGDKRKGSTGTG